MKKVITLIAVALTFSLSMTAQEIVIPDQHGSTVSTVARETTSGPGKGEVVSTQAKTQGEVASAQAKTQGEVKKTEKLSRKELKAQKKLTKQKKLKKNKPGTEKQFKEHARGNRKPETIGRPASTPGVKHVPR